MSLRVISYGGGVQSTALVVLATQGKIGQVDAALFANVGDDSEHPATVRYVRDIMVPWAKERHFDIHELHRTRDPLRATRQERLTFLANPHTNARYRGTRHKKLHTRFQDSCPGEVGQGAWCVSENASACTNWLLY